MKEAKYAKMFMKMAKCDCMLLSINKILKCILTVAVVVNVILSGVSVVAALKK